jgi:DnaJ-class molecular chaperone
MTIEPTDPYTVLGVPRTATRAEITHAYRNRLRACHPDTREQPASADPDAALRAVIAAYAVLRDPDQRGAYDRLHPPARATSRHTQRAASTPPIQAGPVHWWPR